MKTSGNKSFCFEMNGSGEALMLVGFMRFHWARSRLKRLVTSWIFYYFYFLACSGVLAIGDDSLSSSQALKDGDYLSSSNGTFTLGFFSPGQSKNRYLGIWYSDSFDVVVWIANRNDPVTDRGGSLTFDETGKLIILNGTKYVIWSSDLNMSLVNPVAQLLDNGNFILRGNSTNLASDTILWQSFDYPTDTLLPGLKIGWNLKTGRETYLTSWRSLDDPSSGTFTYRLHLDSLPQMVLASESATKYRSGPWKGSFFDALPGFEEYKMLKPMMVINENEISTFGEVKKNTVARLTVNVSGSVQRCVKNLQTGRWDNVYWSPFDVCDNYIQCGTNSICSAHEFYPCQCLKGFQRDIKAGDVETHIWNSNTKCVRATPLNCSKGDSFSRIKNVKLPDMKNVSWNELMGSHECEEECRKNCSCTAYANLNINGTGKGCMMWFGDLVDVRYLTRVKLREQDLYFRVLDSESDDLSKTIKILLIVLALLIFCSFILILFFCFIRVRSNRKELQNSMDDVEVSLFEFNTLDKATDGFAEENNIGEGGFGTVYKGKLPSGEIVAIKRLSRFSGQGIEEFRNEVTLIAKLQHRNLVSLVGICIRGEERMLVYEYMPNKSLDYFLFGQKERRLLMWKERFSIVMGIARGLLYLHQDSKLHVVHRDLKAANILLDSFMNPKISDFGIARIFDDDANHVRTKRVMGTYGYMSPEYASHGKFSDKSDVFSFGVLVLEIISSKKNHGFSHSDHDQNLLGHAWLLWNQEGALDLLDPNLEGTISSSEALRCIHVGLLCVQGNPVDRPDMSTVVFMLANDGINLAQPKQPGFFVVEDHSSASNSSSNVTHEIHHTVRSCSITILEGR